MRDGRIKFNKQVIFATLGNCLECYDATLYSFFATLLAPLFFPSDKPGLSLLSSFAAFALGMAMRPLGGVIFGHIGDQYGRKYALKFSLFLIVLPTLIIGLLPTYQEIGATASLILVTCLLLQGLCLGGEQTGASVFVVEHTKENHPGFWSAVLTASGMVGSLLGTIMGYFFTKFIDPSWGWRFPFLIGGILGLICFYRSYKLQETPDFQKVIDQKLVSRTPLLNVLSNYPLNFLCAICIGGASFIPLYVTTTYLGSILLSDLQVEHHQVMLFCGIAMLLYVVFLPFVGMLADQFGTKKIMCIGAIAMIILPYPLSCLLCTKTVTAVIINQLILTIINIVFAGPTLLFKAGLFPTTSRHSALGVGYNLGGAIFGGTSPLICAYLVGSTGNYSLIGFYVAFGGILGLLAICLGKKVDESFEPKTNKTPNLAQLVA